MSSVRRKVKYYTQGNYGSTEERWLYSVHNNSSDFVTFYDHNGEYLFCFDEWSPKDMGQAIIESLTEWNDEKVIHMDKEDWKKCGIE